MVEDKKDEEKGGDDNSNTIADGNDDDNFAPTTVVILLGSMNFEPVESIDILSLKIQNPDERSEILETASKKIRTNSLEALHILLKSSSVSSLFDQSILLSFYEGIIPGKEVTIHVLPESAALADDMPVHAGDVNAIRMALVTAGLMLQVEQNQDGNWILTATKPGGVEESSDEEDEEAEREPTEAEKQEEQDFQKLVNVELEKHKEDTV